MKHILLLLLLVASIATERTFNLTDWNKTLNVPPEQMSNETKILAMFFENSSGTYKISNLTDTSSVSWKVADGPRSVLTKMLKLSFVYPQDVDLSSRAHKYEVNNASIYLEY